MTISTERKNHNRPNVPMPVMKGAYAQLAEATPGWGGVCIPSTTAIGTVSINRYRASTATLVLVTSESEAPPVAAPWRATLRETQEKLDASVAQISEALGVTRQAYYAWLRGSKNPAPENQKRIGQLRGAAAQLKEALGARLGIYLNYPIGPEDESYWELLAKAAPVKETTATLLAAALKSLKRRRANEQELSEEGER